jgi:hypothetical protein
MWRLGGAEDRRFGASARAQFEPEEQEGEDVDETVVTAWIVVVAAAVPVSRL